MLKTKDDVNSPLKSDSVSSIGMSRELGMHYADMEGDRVFILDEPPEYKIPKEPNGCAKKS